MYQKSETISNLSAALAKAQAGFRHARKSAENPFFKRKYADLAEVMDACRDPLAANGLSVMQPVSSEGQQINVETILSHESGEWVSSCLSLSLMKDSGPQAVGSAISYARRYSLASMVGVVADDDDDGESVEGRREEQSAAKPKKPAPPKEAAPPPTAPPDGENALDAKRRKTLLDLVQAELVKRYPGKDDDSKKKKAEALDILFGTPKWATVMTMPLHRLEHAVKELTGDGQQSVEV